MKPRSAWRIEVRAAPGYLEVRTHPLPSWNVRRFFTKDFSQLWVREEVRPGGRGGPNHQYPPCALRWDGREIRLLSDLPRDFSLALEKALETVAGITPAEVPGEVKG